ncbi:MAG: DedD protein, partial [Acidobacteriota bacterium]|nr:DedD protein [Acidobacteriota bacterium]
VWIGRESTARAQEQIASGTPPPEVKKEGQSVEDLEFFDARKDVRKDKSQPQRDETPASAPTAATAATDTTLAQDLAGKGSAPAPAPEPQEPPSRAAAVPSPAPIPVAPTPEPGRKGKGRNRDRLAEAAATPAATPGATRPARASDIAETAIPKGSSVIQVFSSQDRSQADAIRKRLVKGGQQAYLSPVDVAGHTMYRVRIGPFSSRPDAQKVAEKVRKAYKLDTWVTE